MAGLADAGEQLVDGLGRVDHRLFGTLTLFAHGVEVAVEAVEGRVRQPSFVEVQVGHVAVEHLLDGLGVVKHAVVGGLREREHARLHGSGVHTREQRVGADFFLDRLDGEFALRNRADDAEVVARGLQKHGNRPGHDDAVQDGLVAVAVHHHHVARRHRVVPHHLVGGAGPVGHKEAVVGVENARGVALGRTNRTVVVEQLAELFHRVAHVGAQHVLAIKLVVHLTDGALQKRHATGVAGAVPRERAVLGVIEQGLEKRGLDAFEVALGFANDVTRHELGRVLEHVDKAVQLAQDVVGQVAAGFGFAVDVDRYLGVFAAHLGDELAQVEHRRVQVGAGRELFVVDRQDERTGAALLLRELAQVAVARHPQDLKTLGLHGLGQGADAQTGGVFRAKVFVNDDDGEAKFHEHLPAPRPAQNRTSESDKNSENAKCT